MTAIREWLEGLGLGQYAAGFEAAAVTPGLCSALTDADLERLGVAVLGHRRLIERHARNELPPRAPAPLAGMARPAWVDETPTTASAPMRPWPGSRG